MADELTPNPPEQADNSEETRPEWLPENFKEPEALVESYKEAQRKITELTNQVKVRDENTQSLAERLEQLEAQAAQSQQSQQQYDLYAAYDQAYEQGDTRAMLQINAQIAAAAAQQAVQQVQPQQQGPSTGQSEIVASLAEQAVSQKYDDWDEYKPKVLDVLRQRPGLLSDEAVSSPKGLADALDDAYRIAKFEDYRSGAAQQQQAAELQRQAKLNAQTMQGAGGRPSSPDEAAQRWKEISSAQVGSYSDLFGK
jgi:hypothetical protein